MKAAGTSSYACAKTLLPELLIQQVPAVTLDVADEHRCPARQYNGSLDPSNAILCDDIRGISPKVVVAHGHRNIIRHLADDHACARITEWDLTPLADFPLGLVTAALATLRVLWAAQEHDGHAADI